MLAGMDGQHDEHLKEFFLDLARPAADTDEARAAARERWSAWRRAPANAGVRVDFAGVDFRLTENAAISFAGFEFGDAARFDGATFGDRARFGGATFGEEARFNGTKFRSWANFDRATFGDWLKFDSAKFGSGASFFEANVGYFASFTDATFGIWARFTRTTFGDGARFDSVTFGEGAKFDGATLGEAAKFRGIEFLGDADFAGAPVEPWLEGWRKKLSVDDTGSNDAESNNRVKSFFDWQKAENFGPHTFQRLDFSDARVLGSISFARRSFERPANFTGARFHAPPDFDGATNLQRIDFTGARIGFVPPEHPRWTPHWTDDSTVPIRLRAFRAIAETTKNHDLERDLYIEERKAERGVVRRRLRAAFVAEKKIGRKIARLGPLFIAWCWRRMMDLYWLFSDYGRSLMRPLLWLAVTLPLFVLAFDASLVDRRRAAARAAFEGAATAEIEAWAKTKRDYFAATRQLAISNSIPFVGPLTIDGEVKKFLLCGLPPDNDRLKACVPIAPARYQATLIGQNVLSALLFFFFGLALRNYFKVK